MASSRAYFFSLEHLGIKLGLEQIRALLDALGRPDLAYRSVIVAGTNGKGSVTAMLERGLRASGYRTGRYTSPHLSRLEERFAIDGEDVAPDALDAVLERVERAAAQLPFPPTFFEAATAAALTLFSDAGVEVAVLEVGLGGRLDATNAVAARASAITSIDFDHQALLGNTIEAIAREKAGVIKPGSVCVLAANPPAVTAVVQATCKDVGARLVCATAGTTNSVVMHEGRARLNLSTPTNQYDVTLGLRGRHQVDNAMVTVRLLEELTADGMFHVPATAIKMALEHVVWPGRLEALTIDGREVLIDAAHNAGGARALAAFLHDTYARPLPLVLGVLRDKDVDAIVAAVATAASVIVCTAPSSPRAMSAADLAAITSRVRPDLPVEIGGEPGAAVAIAARHGSPVVVAGSLFLAGDVRALVS